MSTEAKAAKEPLTKEEKTKRILLIVLSAVVVLVIIGGFIFGSPYSIKKNSYSSFEQMVEENYDKPTVLYCTKPSCTSCDKVTPLISQIKDQYKSEVNFYCIDVLDDGEGTELWNKYKPGGIEAGKVGVPCTIYFYARESADDDLKVMTRREGYGGSGKNNTYEDILDKVEKLLKAKNS